MEPPQLSSGYGRSSGEAISSVNGTSALMKLFRQSGKRVSVSRRLGDLVERADVVVWVPDSHALPRAQVTRYFDAWLAEKPGRNLIYVVKEYDGAVDYWTRLASREAGEKVCVQRSLARALAKSDRVQSKLSEEQACDWFRIERSILGRQPIDGGEWSSIFPEFTVSPELGVRLGPQDADVGQSREDTAKSDRLITLLAAGDDVLVAQYERNHWGENRVILFSSGAWLLNLPLVEASNRMVAEQLVRECGAARRVVFLETDEDGPTISDGKQRHHALEAFTVYPFNSILLHLTALGLVFCCAVFPIFGRPKPIIESVRSDFRRHVTALGALLAKTGDTQYARAQRDHYWTKVRRDPGSKLVERTPSEPTNARQEPDDNADSPVEGNPFSPAVNIEPATNEELPTSQENQT